VRRSESVVVVVHLNGRQQQVDVIGYGFRSSTGFEKDGQGDYWDYGHIEIETRRQYKLDSVGLGCLVFDFL
jgi:hypothetical protein